MTRHALVGVAVLLWLALAAAARAESHATLKRSGETARWSGVLSNASAPDPAACTPQSCRSYQLELALGRPRPRRPRGLLVLLRWPPEQLDIGYDLDLYLYGPDGELAARSDAIAYSAAEGLWLQNPRNGRYQIVVMARDVVGTSPYELVATVKPGWSVSTAATLLGTPPGLTAYEPDVTFIGRPPPARRPMLPDLKPVKPSNFHIESTAAGSFYVATLRVPAHQPSCYPQETTGLNADHPGDQQPGALRCLRWDMIVRNVGRGTLEVRAYPNSDEPEASYQAIYESDGSYTLKPIGDAQFSNAHGHVHFHGMDEAALYTIAADGGPGRRVAGMPDKGICMIDLLLLDEDISAAWTGPSRARVPGTCDTTDNQDPDDPLHPDQQYYRQGLSPGWADIYPWQIPDQYVDITNVPDGRYLLVYRVNVSGAIAERTGQNNATSACVEFRGTEVRGC